MNPKQYHDWIKELREISKVNHKVALLKDMVKSDPKFKKVLCMALDGAMHYNISSIPVVEPSRLVTRKPDFNKALLFLAELATKNGATNRDREHLASLVADPDMRALATMIIQKDLKCGIQAKTLNKASPGSVFIMPYQRCSTVTSISNIRFPAALEVKADGMFINAIRIKEGVIYRSRPGNLFPLESPEIDEAILKLGSQEFVLMGEFRIYNPATGEYLPRKRGNGILNSIAQDNKRAIDIYMSRIRYVIWDYIPYNDFINGKCDMHYINRKKYIKTIPVETGSKTKSGKDFLTKTYVHIVDTVEQALEKSNAWIMEGEEGGVLKNYDSTWKNTTSKEWIKLKDEKVCELRITGWEYGKEGSKYESICGALICESECGKLRVNVSGLTDGERSYNWDDYIGKIISVKFNEVITSKSKTTASLNLPRVNRGKGEIEIRHDKTKADTLEEIKSIKSIKVRRKS